MKTKRLVVVAVCLILSALLLLTYVMLFMQGDGALREWVTSDMPLAGQSSVYDTYLYMELDSYDTSYVFASWYLGMAVRTDGQWDTVQFQEPALRPGWVTCYTVDSEGGVHFVHFRDVRLGPKEIYYGTNSDGAWTLEFVDDVSRPDTGWWRNPMPRIAMDNSGAAHLCYHSTASGHFLRYATNAGGAWEVTQIADAPHCDGINSVVRNHLLIEPAALFF